MKCKDAKIVCNDKEVAKISCSKDGITIKATKEGKNLCEEFKGCC